MSDNNDELELTEQQVEKLEQSYAPAVNTEEERPTKVTAKSRRENVHDVTQEDVDYIYERRRTYMLDAADRRAYYNEGSATHYAGEESAEGELREEKDEAIILSAAARVHPPEILDGIVVGYSETENEHIPMVIVELANSEGYNIIKIPVSQFFYYDKKEYIGESGRKLLAAKVETYFGAKIKFVVFEYNEKEHVAYGSRLQAMDILSNVFYRKTNKNGDARVRVGEAATATVISVMRDRLEVDVCGADITIKSRELDHLALGPINETFSVGDTFPVKMLAIPAPTKVEINGRTYTLMLGCEASRKALRKNPADKYYDRYKRGDVVAGVIKSENSASGIFVNIQNHLTVLCDTAPGNPPIDSTCNVLIVNKYDDTKQIRGNIIAGTIRPPRAKF